jgi:tight adherence protein B
MDSGLLVIICGILGFVAVAGVGFVFAGGGGSQAKALKRAQAIVQAGPARDARARAANTSEQRRKQILKSLQEQDRQQKKARLTLDNKILMAGLRISVLQFYIISAVVGLIFMAAAALMAPNRILLAPILGAAMGAGLPLWTLNFLGQRRVKAFTEAFSDAMDIIVRGIKSGLPVHDCLKIIARESPQPLSGEFARLVENIGMGVSLDQALEKLFERMPTPELRFFAIVMAVQQKTGGNLAEALANLSAVLRARKLMREKIKALSSEAVASASIIGVLPPGVVVLINITTPTYMAPMFVDPRGQLMLAAGVGLMGTGIWIMRRMINFKF